MLTSGEMLSVLLIYQIVQLVALFHLLLAIESFNLLLVRYIFGSYYFAIVLPLLLEQGVGDSIFGTY